MKSRACLAVLAVALAVVFGAGAHVASNMGFKIEYPMLGTGAGSASGLNLIALPDYKMAGIVHAGNLMTDMGFPNVASVSRFIEANDALETYTGRKSGGVVVPFPLGNAGLYVRMLTTIHYIIVGSHDPSLVHPLDAAGAGSNSGLNLLAYPYHHTAVDAKALMDDIGFTNVASVSRFLRASDTLQTYTGRKSGGIAVPFPLTPGEAYFVRMNTTVNYIPSHY
jgi:hypothetical protein